MANTRSDIMAPRFTSPPTLNSVSVSHSRLRTKRIGITAAGTGEPIGYMFPMARFQGTDRIMSIKVANDDLGTTLTVDVGVYVAGDWSAADQTELDGDIWCDGLDLGAARNEPTEVLHVNIATACQNLARKVFVDAGIADTDAARPTAGTEYDMVMKIATTGTPAAGDVLFIVEYVAGD